MDGLAEFEKNLAKEKEEREKESRRKERSHRHHHDHHDHHDRRSRDSDRHAHRHEHSSRHDRHDRHERHERHDRHEKSSHADADGDGHRRKRRRPEGDEDAADGGDSKVEGAAKKPLERDAWMAAPSSIEIDYVQRREKEEAPAPKHETRHQIAERELNKDALQHLNSGMTLDELETPAQPQASYEFGDSGSQWRMTKLNGVYTLAEKDGRSVEEVAVERFGSLREFDEAREEKEELERRRLYGKGYRGKSGPTGDLYEERIKGMPQPTDDGDDGDEKRNNRSDRSDGPLPAVRVEKRGQSQPGPMDQTALNRLRAQLMKAKLRNAPDVAQLEQEYEQAMAAAMAASRGGQGQQQATDAVVLDPAYNRMLAGPRGEVKAVQNRRGRERGNVEANEDMSIDDMVREERRTRGAQGGENVRLAERIAKDSKFDDDLEYLDENAEKLAKRTHKSEQSLKNMAVSEYSKMNRILESCPLCHHEDRQPPLDRPLAPIVSLATQVFLTLPTEPELTGSEGGAVIVPMEHHTNLLECSDDEWEEIRNFMKSLTRLYHEQGRDVIFYENAAAPHRRMHAALVAAPIPYELGATAPAFFRDAMLTADEEWSQHKKIIDTGKRAREGLGKQAFRKSIAKEMPYFHAWFTLDGGLGHVVEDAGRWPRGDLFAREILGGMLDTDPSIIKRQGRWNQQDGRVDDFKKRWRKFDWTRVLTESL